MADIEYYGVIAVKFSGDENHHHYISHVYMITKNKDGYNHPGILYTKARVIELLKTYYVYTLEWNYSTGRWNKGAEVRTVTVGGNTYLRTSPDHSVTDNLDTCIDYDFFRC